MDVGPYTISRLGDGGIIVRDNSGGVKYWELTSDEYLALMAAIASLVSEILSDDRRPNLKVVETRDER